MTGAPVHAGVIGAGAWGTALAHLLAGGGHRVTLWAHSRAAEIARDRCNARYLPGVVLDDAIAVTARIGDLAACDPLLVVTPAQAMGAVIAPLAAWRGDLVLCAKGIEQASGRLMIDVARAACPEAGIAVLSGPTFAHEVAAGLPTAVTLACAGGHEQWARLAPVFASQTFRPYYSHDVIGAEIGGAVKNVLALACGVVEGLGLGQNARAALISRGQAEMVRFAIACGAEAETLGGLSGLGDLVLTCNSPASRNFAFGRALGAGEVWQADGKVAEGAHTAPVLVERARALGVDMPIAEAVAALVSGAIGARAMADALLARPLRSERDGATMRDPSARAARNPGGTLP